MTEPVEQPKPVTVHIEFSLTEFMMLCDLLNWAQCFVGRASGAAANAIRLMKIIAPQAGMTLSSGWDERLRELTTPEPQPQPSPDPPKPPGFWKRFWNAGR